MADYEEQLQQFLFRSHLATVTRIRFRRDSVQVNVTAGQTIHYLITSWPDRKGKTVKEKAKESSAVVSAQAEVDSRQGNREMSKAKRDRLESEAEKELLKALDKALSFSGDKKSTLSVMDGSQRTLLHLSVLHRMPDRFIVGIVKHMTSQQVDQLDCHQLSAVDYLLEWEVINPVVLRFFIDSGVDLIGRTVGNSPFGRICRRPGDGHKLLESAIEGHLTFSKQFLNVMLEEAVKGGSAETVKMLLNEKADPTASERCLLHDAAKANHHTLDKVELLVYGYKIEQLGLMPTKTILDPSQTNAAGLTLVHVAADGKPPRLDLLYFSLLMDVDPNRTDNDGDTALHKVTKNYADRKVGWKTSKQAMEILLKHQADPNIVNNKGFTPLRILMTAKRDLNPHLLIMWKHFKANFEGHVDPESPEALNKSPLAGLCKRRDGPRLLAVVIQQLGDTAIKRCSSYMLEAAVTDGTAEMVEELLKTAGAKANEGQGVLLKHAVASEIEADQKLSILFKYNANREYKDAKGYSLLHLAAQSAAATTEVLRTCTDPNCLNLELDVKDNEGNTPLHVAAMSGHPNSHILLQALADKRAGGDPNAENRIGYRPLGRVLQENQSDLELCKCKVKCLLVNGCQPTLKDFDDYNGDAQDFQNLFLSATSDVVISSSSPIQFLLLLGRYCKERYKKERKKHFKLESQSNRQGDTSNGKRNKNHQWGKTLQWRNLKDSLENEAVLMIEEFGKDQTFLKGVMTNDDIKEARELKWSKFLANKSVSKLVTQMFYGQVDPITGEGKEMFQLYRGKKWFILLTSLVLLFVLQSLLTPVYIVKYFLLSCCRKCDTTGRDGEDEEHLDIFQHFYVHPKEIPAVTFFSSMMGYLVFLGFLIAHTAVDNVDRNFLSIDWIILFYVTAMAAEEMYQVFTCRRGYLTLTNIIDVIMIACFIIYFFIRGIGSTGHNLQLLRVSEHVFAVAAALSCLRVLYYMQVNYKLGPIQIAFFSITAEVVSFMAILGVALLAFGVAISGVYSAGEYTTAYRNGSISLPQPVNGLWPALQTMYWSLYGHVNYEDLKSEHEVLLPETVVGLALFGFWLLISIIVLLNMLIALVDEAFDRVRKQNADFVWNVAVSGIVRDIHSSPSLPLPFNLFCILALFVMQVRQHFPSRCEDCRCPRSRVDNSKLSLISFPECIIERMIKLYQNRKKRDKSSPDDHKDAIKPHLATLEEKLRNMMNSHMTRIHSQLKRANTIRKRSSSQDDPDGRRNQHEKVKAASNEDTDTEEEEEQRPVRYERVSYDESGSKVTVSYEGKTNAVGGCQFLRTPMSKDFKYFEVVIEDYGKHGRIGVGLTPRNYSLHRMPGWNKDSIAFHCDDGKLFHQRGWGEEMASPAQQDDVIGCGINTTLSNKGTENTTVVFFTRNGQLLGSRRVNLPDGGFYPTVGLHSEGEKVEVRLSGRWEPPEDKNKETLSRMIPFVNLRMRRDTLHYNELTRRLRCNSKSSSKGVFQDLGHPITDQFNYYEVKLLDMGLEGAIGIGIANNQYPLDRMPGWDDGSAAYHCDNGIVYKGLLNDSTFSPAQRTEMIGCGVEFLPGDTKRAKVFFTRNGNLFEKHETSIPSGGFYPTIGMVSAGEEIEINYDAKWPPQKFRSERVLVEGDVIKYIGDRVGSVGACQFLRRPLSRDFSYYEVTVKGYGMKGEIAIGLARRDYPLSSLPGWQEGSIGWHCDDGGLYNQEATEAKESYTPAREGDVIGCGIDFKRSQAKIREREGSSSESELVVYFTMNGEKFAERTIPAQQGGLFPTVGLHSMGELAQVDFSATWRGATRAVDRSLGNTRHERVRIEGDCISYVGNIYNDVGGVQLDSSMEEVSSKYFEVTIVNAGERGTIGIGIARRDYPLDCQPGWVKHSIAYHCDDGLFYCNGEERSYDYFPSSAGDVIGCGIRNTKKRGQELLTVFFTHNSKEIGQDTFANYQAAEFYPTICMHSFGEKAKINLKASPPVDQKHVLFARSERMRINGNKAYYEPNQYMDVGGFQLSNAITEKEPCFRIKVINFGKEGAICVGLAPRGYPLYKELGWLPGSVGYHCDNGCLYKGARIGHRIHRPAQRGDETIIGCGIDYHQTKTRTDNKVVVFFTHNGNKIPTDSVLVHKPITGLLFPTVGMNSPEEAVEVITDIQQTVVF